MADKKQLFIDLLRYLEGGDANRPISVFVEGASWDFEAQDLKDILLAALFEVPALRKELDLALKDVETLQEQIAGKTSSFGPQKVDRDPFRNLLRHIEKLSENPRLTIEIEGQHEKWLFEVQELKNVLQSAVEMVALEKSISRQAKIVAAVPGETLSFGAAMWEYRTVYLSSRQRPHDDKLNELGDDGWELVAVANSAAYFKRVK